MEEEERGREGGREGGRLTVLIERATKDVVTRSFSHWHYFTYIFVCV